MARNYVSANTTQSYDDFVAQRDPFNLAAELAAMRALVVEYRQSLEESSEAKNQEYFGDVARDLHMVLRMSAVRYPELSRELMDEIEKSVSALVQQSFTRLFPANTRLQNKDAETMSKLLRNIVESAEKYKKIFDGITIGLDIDGQLENFLQVFVVKYILPNIAVHDRLAVANAVMEFLPQIQAPSTGIPPSAKVIR